MVRASATVTGVTRAPLVRAWEAATPLTPVGFYPKSGLLPGVIEVRNQTGQWDAVGQTRKLMLSDGGHVVERTVQVDKPGIFVYELSDFQKLFGKLVAGARAEWEFTTVAAGTEIRWTYSFHPMPRAGIAVWLIVTLLWAPYMKRVLPGIIREVDRVGA